MARSKEQIAEMAARILRIVPTSQAAGGYDNAVILTSVETTYAELATMGLASWDIDSVPDEVAPGLAMYVAGDAADQLTTPELAVYHKGNMALALRRITAAAGSRDYSDEPVHFTDF